MSIAKQLADLQTPPTEAEVATLLYGLERTGYGMIVRKLAFDRDRLLDAARMANAYLAKEAATGRALTVDEWSETQQALSNAIRRPKQ